MEAINNLLVPASRQELLRFLGMPGYYHAFYKNFAQVVVPLTDLISPEVVFRWRLDCQQAFEKTKTLLVSASVLAAPDFRCPFALYTNVSDRGTGAVLRQKDDKR